MTELFLESEFQHNENKSTKKREFSAKYCCFLGSNRFRKQDYSNTTQKWTKNKIGQNCHRQDRNLPLKRQSRLQQTTFINIFSSFFWENKTWCFKWILMHWCTRETATFYKPLTLKAPITTAADDIHKYFSLFFWENKTWCFKWILMHWCTQDTATFYKPLTLKAPITTAADDIHKYFSLFFWENKTWCFKWILMHWCTKEAQLSINP